MFVRHRLLSPLKLISAEAQRFALTGEIAEQSLEDKITYNDELGALALVIDDMEKRTIQNFETISKITAEKNRVNSELNLASAIQANMLPGIFPPFPDHGEFDIYATMDPAREVGGDFYDFFMVDKTHVAIVIGDVSGKGIPAALYMVITKTLIKNHVQLGLPLSEVFYKVNNMLCEGNKVGLFVTAWMGILDIESGKFTYVNAGHNPPLIKQNGKFEYLKSRAGFVLAGMEGVKYVQNELTMSKGDKIFIYTDGVTEATSSDLKLYGEERLKSYLNANADMSIEKTIKGIRADVDKFVGEAEQFDDMTMLILEYNDEKRSKAKDFPATDESLAGVLEFVEETTSEYGLDMASSMKVQVSTEEMFVNIAHYAYVNKCGSV
ncbi:MAG: SpoIIE family protein phosphatase, partial [Clostridia bacterium]|nr:SpoIIE family protein phosphatase [Clostridia bacterium]